MTAQVLFLMFFLKKTRTLMLLRSKDTKGKGEHCGWQTGILVWKVNGVLGIMWLCKIK